jgi:hypothetical protein
MNIKCISALALLLPAVVFAQGKPSQPGPPSTQPQSVVDATGKIVGEIIAGGYGGASIKYVLSTGGFVVLQASSTALTNLGASGTALFGKVYFKESDCSGDAYLTLGPTTIANQLTRQQAMVLTAPIFSTPPSPFGNCPMGPILFDSWLYVADTSACPVLYFPGDPAHSVTFSAVYAFGPTGTNCMPLAGPPQGGAFQAFHRVEDLTAKFPPPYLVQ